MYTISFTIHQCTNLYNVKRSRIYINSDISIFQILESVVFKN